MIKEPVVTSCQSICLNLIRGEGAVAFSECDRNIHVYAHSPPVQLKDSRQLSVNVPKSDLSLFAEFCLVLGDAATLLGRKTSEILRVFKVGVDVKNCDMALESVSP